MVKNDQNNFPKHPLNLSISLMLTIFLLYFDPLLMQMQLLVFTLHNVLTLFNTYICSCGLSPRLSTSDYICVAKKIKKKTSDDIRMIDPCKEKETSIYTPRFKPTHTNTPELVPQQNEN